MYIPNLSVVCFFICLSYFIFYCALLLFCAQAWHGKTLSSRNYPICFCSLHWRNLSLYNKITTSHFKQIRFWWKNVITFRGKVYSNFFKFVQQLFFLSVVSVSSTGGIPSMLRITSTLKPWMREENCFFHSFSTSAWRSGRKGRITRAGGYGQKDNAHRDDRVASPSGPAYTAKSSLAVARSITSDNSLYAGQEEWEGSVSTSSPSDISCSSWAEPSRALAAVSNDVKEITSS